VGGRLDEQQKAQVRVAYVREFDARKLRLVLCALLSFNDTLGKGLQELQMVATAVSVESPALSDCQVWPSRKQCLVLCLLTALSCLEGAQPLLNSTNRSVS
jgi:hypothetical protein